MESYWAGLLGDIPSKAVDYRKEERVKAELCTLIPINHNSPIKKGRMNSSF
jgi:hypothetical protein